jgi:hypothetical protein
MALNRARGDRNVSKLRERDNAANQEAAELILHQSAEAFWALQVAWAEATLKRLGRRKHEVTAWTDCVNLLDRGSCRTILATARTVRPDPKRIDG